MAQGKLNAASFFPPFVVTLLGTAFSAFVVGCAYALAAWYSPFALLNVSLTIGVACLLGWLVAKLAVACVMPSRKALCLVGVLAGLIALYSSWGTNAAIRIPGIVTEGFSPGFLSAFAHELYTHGSVEIEGDAGNTEFKGPGLLVLWIVEAVILAVGATIATTTFFQHLAPPLCQECRVWQSEKHGILRLGLPEDVNTFAARIRVGDFGCLDDLPDGSVDDDPHIRIDVGWCPSCNDKCVASASVVSYSSDPSEVPMCHHVDIPPAALRQIQTRAVNRDPPSAS